jgi:hypothetical protein
MPYVHFYPRTELLKDTAKLLNFPFVATITALVYLHRLVRATNIENIDVVNTSSFLFQCSAVRTMWSARIGRMPCDTFVLVVNATCKVIHAADHSWRLSTPSIQKRRGIHMFLFVKVVFDYHTH